MLTQLENHSLLSELFEDFRLLGIDEFDETEIETFFSAGPMFDRHLTYMHNCYAVIGELYDWLAKLSYSLNRITGYSSTNSISEAKNFVFELENHYIRLYSLFERILQLLNSVFNLGYANRHVNDTAITKNVKVRIYPEIINSIKTIRQTLSPYMEWRNTIVHRHQLKNKDLLDLQAYGSEIYLDKKTWKLLRPYMTDKDYDEAYRLTTELLKCTAFKMCKDLEDLEDELHLQIVSLLDLLLPVYQLNKKLEKIASNE